MSSPHSDAPKQVVGELVNEREEEVRKRLQGIAWLFDESITIPGVNYRIGIDGLIGLIPGLGDIVSASVSMYLIAEASRLGASKPVILRMGANVLIDTLLGAIPMLGDLFDFAWKANSKNVALLNQYLDNPRHVRRSSTLMVVGIAALLVLAIVGIFFLISNLIAWFIQLF